MHKLGRVPCAAEAPASFLCIQQRGTKRKSRLDRRAMVSINHRDKKEWVVADLCSFRASAAFPEKLNTLEMICTNVTQKQKETA